MSTLKTLAYRDHSTTQRHDIQALRAVAVGAVVLNHVWPGRLPGGYVGVDVFFVISGFLITTHLIKELDARRTVALGQFYARRVRRLLPAALLVLAISAVAAWVCLPYSQWTRNGEEIVSSAFYVENWFLAARSVNYSALNDAASVAQHYWSLSVEEQFYLVWPIFLIGLWWLADKVVKSFSPDSTSLDSVPPRPAWVTPIVGMGVVIAASLAYSMWMTTHHPSPAYFVTPARFWEFGLGGVLALVGRRIDRSNLNGESMKSLWSVTAHLASIMGFALIIGSAFVYDHATPFPGWRALIPALGTGLVIASGTFVSAQWHGILTSLRPIQWAGDISYSLYLWHWPIVVLAPFVLSRQPGLVARAIMVLLAVILSWLSYTFVENPGRHWAWLQVKLRRTFVSMVAAMVFIGLLSGGLALGQNREQAIADHMRTTAKVGGCVGPKAMSHVEACPAVFGPARNPVMTEESNAYYLPINDEHCQNTVSVGDRENMVCDFSAAESDPVKVLLLGDSHAQQWQYALLNLARQHHWILSMTYEGACPAADVAYIGYRGDTATPEKVAACATWRTQQRDFAVSDGTDMVFLTFFAREERVDDGSGRSQAEQYEAGLMSYAAPLLDAGAKVYILGDPPLNSAVRDANCPIFNKDDPSQCAVSRSIAQPDDPLLAAAEASNGTIVGIDLTNRFCDEELCYVVIGGVPIYFDLDHLNRVYVELLVPYIEAEL